MDNKLEVPYIVYEGEQARHERTIKRLIIALVVAIALIFLSNAAWLLYISGFDVTDGSISVETQDGIANYIGQNGDITNGEN